MGNPSSSRRVIGEGPRNAKVMLIGQNPGKEEIKSGRPFVGRAGKYLDKVLEKNKINRKKLFITSVVKHATPKNRKPTAKEIKKELPFLLKQIRTIKPKIIVLMGEIAWKTLPCVKGKEKDKKIKIIKTYHPAAAMRFPKIKKKFEDDFKYLKKLI